MRIIIAVIAGVLAGLGVRTLTSPTAKEITESAPSYAESHGEMVKLAEMKAAAAKPEPEPPLNPAYPEALTVRGYIIRGARVNVLLSDGTIWTEKTGGLERVERSHVLFAGKRYPLRASREIQFREAGLETKTISP